MCCSCLKCVLLVAERFAPLPWLVVIESIRVTCSWFCLRWFFIFSPSKRPFGKYLFNFWGVLKQIQVFFQFQNTSIQKDDVKPPHRHTHKPHRDSYMVSIQYAVVMVIIWHVIWKQTKAMKDTQQQNWWTCIIVRTRTITVTASVSPKRPSYKVAFYGFAFEWHHLNDLLGSYNIWGSEAIFPSISYFLSG